MKITDHLGVETIHDLQQRGSRKGRLVNIQKHPTEPLAIANYTSTCVWLGEWDQTTLNCRGVIWNTETGEIVSRPFPKFFNHGEARNPVTNTGPVRVQDKMDGSLGILYQTPSGDYGIATRGSFTSPQAIHGTHLLRKIMDETGWQPYAGFTYLFEIIYPENRIVVDYHGMDEIILLDVINNTTGLSALGAMEDLGLPFGVAETASFDTLADFISMMEEDGEVANAEGFVVYFKQTGERVKFKYEEYKRLHKILTGVSTKTIWEYLSTGQDFEHLLDVVPDEFYDWVREQVAILNEDYARIANTTWRAFQSVYRYVITSMNADPAFKHSHRKEFAQAIKDSEFKDILFGYYDDKDVSPMIWKRLKPQFSKPFWNIHEDVA